MTFADAKGVSGGEVKEIRTRFFVVPFVQGTREGCLEQILVPDSGRHSSEQTNEAFVRGDSRVPADPAWLFHFLDSSA